jgi:WD40 repeat protein
MKSYIYSFIRLLRFGPLGCLTISLGVLLPPSASAMEPHNILRGHEGPITALSFSSDGAMVASASSDHTVRVWNVKTAGAGQLERTLLVNTAVVHAVAFSPSKSLLAGGGNDQVVRVWNIGKTNSLRALAGHKAGITSLAFATDGQLMASADLAGVILLWDTRSWKLAQRFTNQTSHILALRFSSDNEYLACGSYDSFKIWSLTAPFTKSDFFREAAWAIGFVEADLQTDGDPKPKFATFDGEEHRLWQPSQFYAGTSRKKVGWSVGPWKHHIGAMSARSSLRGSPVALDGYLVAVGESDGKVRLWDSNRFAVATILAHEGCVTAVAIPPGASMVASGGEDKLIKIWKTKSILFMGQ